MCSLLTETLFLKLFTPKNLLLLFIPQHNPHLIHSNPHQIPTPWSRILPGGSLRLQSDRSLLCLPFRPLMSPPKFRTSSWGLNRERWPTSGWVRRPNRYLYLDATPKGCYDLFSSRGECGVEWTVTGSSTEW